MSKNKIKKKKKQTFGSLVAVFLAVFISSTAILSILQITTDPETGGVFSGLIFNTTPTDERLSKDMVPISVDESSPFYEAFQTGDRINVLLLGLNENMTDTIMVASYDIDNQKVSIISIPRDTFYQRKGIKNAAEYKINSIYAKNKSAVEVATAVSDVLFGMPIHFYAIVDFNDIIKIMDVIGGVEMDIPFHMKYIDTTPGYELKIDIPKGKQTIDSSNVIQFLRFRKSNYEGYQSYTTGDIQRTEMQRTFIQKVLAKCLKAGNLKDVVKVVLDNVECDMTFQTAIKVVSKVMSGFSTENIEAYVIGGEGMYLASYGNLSFYIRDDQQISDMLKIVYNLAEPETSTGTSAAIQ